MTHEEAYKAAITAAVVAYYSDIHSTHRDRLSAAVSAYLAAMEAAGFVVVSVPLECTNPPDNAPICAEPAERSAWQDGYEVGFNACCAMLASRPKVTP